MDTGLILDFLSDLEKNNDREWFHANKERRTKANAAFEELLQALMLEIGQFDGNILGSSPKELTFKLVRDTRFSHDKSPYLPAFRAHISSRGKLPIPVGYYLMIRPGDRSFLGGGLFGDMFKDATAMVRQAIADKPEEFRTGAAALLVEKAEALEEYQPGYWSDYADIIARWNEGTVLFDEEGMLAVYSPYLLGPYAMGEVELRLGYDELAELIGPGGLERLGVEMPS